MITATTKTKPQQKYTLVRKYLFIICKKTKLDIIKYSLIDDG